MFSLRLPNVRIRQSHLHFSRDRLNSADLLQLPDFSKQRVARNVRQSELERVQADEAPEVQCCEDAGLQGGHVRVLSSKHPAGQRRITRTRQGSHAHYGARSLDHIPSRFLI